MISATLQKQIEEALSQLLAMAKELTWNDPSANCRFILSEISHTEDPFFRQRPPFKTGKQKKAPLSLEQAMSLLQQLYADLYDVNLSAYRATKSETIIDIR